MNMFTFVFSVAWSIYQLGSDALKLQITEWNKYVGTNPWLHINVQGKTVFYIVVLNQCKLDVILKFICYSKAVTWAGFCVVTDLNLRDLIVTNFTQPHKHMRRIVSEVSV